MTRPTSALLLALLSACSTTTEKTGPSLEGRDGFCAEWASRACGDRVVDRCAAADREACVAAQADFCRGLVPDGSYSSRTAEECLVAVQSAYEDAELTGEEREIVLEVGGACDHILSGSTGAGGECVVDADCNRDVDLACVRKAGQPTGTCQEPVEVGGGLDCSAPETTCADGFYCDGDNCIAEQGEGETCSDAEPCGGDFQCLTAAGTPPVVADGGLEAATCVARAARGESCSTADDCVTGICAGVAGSDTGVCAEHIVLAPSEQICLDLR